MEAGSQGNSLADEYAVSEDFFFEDLFILVDECMYKLPKRNFVSDSEVFADMCKMPLAEGTPADGSCKEHPLRLEGVKRYDFESLVRVMFPPNFSNPDSLTMNQWASVLKLSAMWNFERIRGVAIDNLRSITETNPILAVAMAKQANVDDWLVPAIEALAKRDAPISIDEVEILGIEMALKIMQVRERAINIVAEHGDIWNAGKNMLIKPSRENLDFGKTIKDVFDL